MTDEAKIEAIARVIREGGYNPATARHIARITLPIATAGMVPVAVPDDVAGLVEEAMGWAESIAQHLCHEAERPAAIRLIADGLTRYRAAALQSLASTLAQREKELVEARAFIARQANSINIQGSPYDKAVSALEEMMLSIKREARAQLKGTTERGDHREGE